MPRRKAACSADAALGAVALELGLADADAAEDLLGREGAAADLAADRVGRDRQSLGHVSDGDAWLHGAPALKSDRSHAWLVSTHRLGSW